MNKGKQDAISSSHLQDKDWTTQQQRTLGGVQEMLSPSTHSYLLVNMKVFNQFAGVPGNLEGSYHTSVNWSYLPLFCLLSHQILSNKWTLQVSYQHINISSHSLLKPQVVAVPTWFQRSRIHRLQPSLIHHTFTNRHLALLGQIWILNWKGWPYPLTHPIRWWFFWKGEWGI